MPGRGTPGRSGGDRRSKAIIKRGDGPPVSPRVLSPRAQALYQWLSDRLQADDPQSGFNRIDGTVIATLAEVLESQEHVASALADNPTDNGLIRLRGSLADRVRAYSALLGMAPMDRARLPTSAVDDDEDDPVMMMLKRMSRRPATE
jgi:phage terminase small subunit